MKNNQFSQRSCPATVIPPDRKTGLNINRQQSGGEKWGIVGGVKKKEKREWQHRTRCIALRICTLCRYKIAETFPEMLNSFNTDKSMLLCTDKH